MEHQYDGNTNGHRKTGTETGGVGNKRTRGANPNNSIVETG